MANPAPEHTPQPPETFEAALSELESIVLALETGQQSLEDALGGYRRGVSLLQYCQATLSAAEQQLQVLENGQLRPFQAGGKDR